VSIVIVPADERHALVGKGVVDLASRVPLDSPPSIIAASTDSDPFRLATKAGLNELRENVAISTREGGR
jgi:hypothetical protein